MNTQISTSSLPKNQTQDGTQARNDNGARQPPRNSVMPSPLIGEHPEIFAEEKQRELEPGILDVIPGDDLRLALRQVERRAVRFRRRRDHEQDEPGKSPRRQHMPLRQPTPNTPPCASTISTVDSEPAIMTTVTAERISGTS